MTYICVQFYCPRCGGELEGEGEPSTMADVVFVGQRLPPVKAYLFCKDCGWSRQDTEAFQQVQGAIDELERA